VHLRYRKLIGLGIPLLLVHVIWWSQMIKNDTLSMFNALVGPTATPAYYMSITMIFGSMFAGATSEGGAAVAFPVMTLIFNIAPPVARDFSFMIQSVGMTAASFNILFMRVHIVWTSVIYCTIGGLIGVTFGLEHVAPQLTPPYAKMYFVVIWASFAGALYWLNRIHDRPVYLTVNPTNTPEIWQSADLVPHTWRIAALVLNWKALTLLAGGFLGGIFTSMSGSGIDICSFALLTLYFRVSEKVATPTSVVLMAVNSFIAMCYRQFYMEGLHPEAWSFFVVCVPIVVIGAPMGALVGSYFHRLVLAGLVYFVDAAQLIGALAVVQPWSDLRCNASTRCTPGHLSGTSAAVFVSGSLAFYALQRVGEKILLMNDEIETRTIAKSAAV